MRIGLGFLIGFLVLAAGLGAVGGVSLVAGVPVTGGLGQARLWWIDNAAPSVAIVGPSGPMSGTIRLSAAIRDELPAAVVDASLDGRPLPPGPSLEIDTRALADGPHELRLTAEDQSRRRNRGQAAFTFRVDNTPPRLDLRLDPEVVGQGKTTYIALATDAPPGGATLAIDGRPVETQSDDDRIWLVWGTAPDATPGSQRVVSATASDAAGNRSTITRTVTITAFAFPIERIEAPPDVAEALGEDTVRAEGAAFADLTSVYRPEKLWAGSFQEPVDAPLSSEFGTRRAYNVSAPGANHGGVDYAAWTGTPVLADAAGVVVLSERQQVRGNLVVLDHGLGVFTAFFHLSEREVGVGDRVEPGDLIGQVGTTGLSTGPHLHWEMRIRGVPVDPLQWTRWEFPPADR